MSCSNCEDTGYRFDTSDPCLECGLGKPIRYRHNKEELERVLIRANTLRVKILSYENEVLK